MSDQKHMESTKQPTRGKHVRIRVFKRIVKAMKGLNRTDADLVARSIYICHARAKQ